MKPFLCNNCLVLEHTMRKLHSLLLLIFIPVLTWCQNAPIQKITGVISGNIQDGKTGKAIQGATVILYSKENKNMFKNSITDKNGEYIFDKTNFGYYQLSIKMIGYAHYQLDSLWLRSEKDEIYLSDIQLKDSSNALNEVVVYAEKKLIEEKDGVLTYNVAESPLNNGSSTSDMLKNIPLVNANPDGSITVKGKGPLILIDEKPTNLNAQQLADLLESLPANMVEKVEVMQTPPPEYATYDGSVINIVTKKGRVGLYQRYAASAGTSGSKSISSHVNYKSNSFSFNSNFNLGINKAIGNSWSHRKNIYTDSVNYLYNESSYINKSINPSLRLQASVDYNKQSNSDFVYQGNLNYIDNTSHTLYSNLNNQMKVWKASNRNVNYDGNTYSHGLTGSYMWKSKTGLEKIQIYSGINFGKNVNNKSFYQQYLLSDLLPNGLDSTQNQLMDNYSTSYYVRGNYTKPFNQKGKTLFTSGLSFTENDYHTILNANYLNKLDSSFYPNELLNSDFFFYQGILTARMGIVFILPAGWRITINEQGEYTNTRFRFIKGNIPNSNADYWRFLPSITIRKEFSKQFNTSFTYRETIRRPGITELNPNIDYTDAYNIRFGNPFIQPTLTQNFEWNLSYSQPKFNVNTTYGYNKINDVFSSVRTLISTGKTQTTYQNISDQDEYHANIWSGINVSNKFKLNISSGINYNKYSPIEKLLYKYIDGSSYYAGLNYSYMPNNLTMIEASNKYNNFASPQGKTRSNISMSFSLQRKLMNKQLVLNLAAIDPFGLTTYTGYTAGSNFTIDSYSQNNVKNFRFTVSYNFNKTYNKKLKG